MDEYQYYEFQAIDRPLDEADRKALGKLSTRARITRTSLTVHYDWGDFKGDPNELMRRWFDAHVYVGYGRGRRLMIRIPKRLIGRVPDDEKEPLGGIGPLSGGLEALAEFLELGADLVEAAAATPANSAAGQPSPKAVRATVTAIPETEKALLLQRLAEGDPHVVAEVQKRVRDAVSAEARPERRAVAELLARAEEIGKAREAAEAKRREEERLEQKRRDEQLRRALLDYLRRRGPSVWREIEAEIDKRVHTSYDRAARLIFDLRDLAEEDGDLVDFSERVNALRARHHSKTAFLRRLAQLDDSDEPDDA